MIRVQIAMQFCRLLNLQLSMLFNTILLSVLVAARSKKYTASNAILCLTVSLAQQNLNRFILLEIYGFQTRQ